MRSSPSARVEAAPARTAFLTRRPYAHRGLHGGAIVENSRAAFAAAVAAGHGIECDVRASRDGEAFVFHDRELDRLTDAQGLVAERSAKALDGIRLKGSGETVPTLHAMLAEVLGKTPVLIEIKADGRRAGALCLAVRRDLEGYRGPVAVMSFNPEVGRWFARRAPHVVRGLVVTEEGRRGLRGHVSRHLALLRSRAEFLAYDVRDLPSRFAAYARTRGLPVLTWTVRSAAQEQLALAHADEIIYERAR